MLRIKTPIDARSNMRSQKCGAEYGMKAKLIASRKKHGTMNQKRPTISYANPRNGVKNVEPRELMERTVPTYYPTSSNGISK